MFERQPDYPDGDSRDAAGPERLAAVYLAAFGGLRAGELWALKLDRVNVLAGTVEVVASASEAGGWHAGPTKTGKRRTIVVPRFLAVMLGQHVGRYRSPDGYVFAAAEGGPIHHHNFRRRHFVPAIEASGLSGVRFHDLRHTCASLLIAAGRSLQEVKEHLGHSSIRVTSDRYAHLYPEARVAMAEALDALYHEAVTAPHRFRGPCGPECRRQSLCLTCTYSESGRRDSNPRPQPWQVFRRTSVTSPNSP